MAKQIMRCLNMNRSKIFALTFTLIPEVYILCPDLQLEKTYEDMNEILGSIGGLDYTYVPEETEHGNIHYHGILTFLTDRNLRSVRKAINKIISLYPYFGFFDIRKCFDAECWLKYMYKKPYKPHSNNIKVETQVLQLKVCD